MPCRLHRRDIAARFDHPMIGFFTSRLSGRRELWLYLILILGSFAIRCGQFGNTSIHIDENFYLLVGDRILHGAIPYVDIWDRKPVGLFLLYAGIRLLGGAGILQYQIVATLFAATTAILIARMALRMTTPFAAGVAGLVYVLLLGLAEGSGGQAPVFYNLCTAGAAVLVLRCWLGEARGRHFRVLGCWAMLLLGIGMQIKYTVVFEGTFFGILLLIRGLRDGRGPKTVAVDAAIWMVIAIAPTAAMIVFYAAIGHLDACIFSNFTSISARGVEAKSVLRHRLLHSWMAVHLPIFIALMAGVAEPWRRYAQGPATFGFAFMWAGAAIAGYLLFGTYFDHYALPLMVPISLAASPMFGHRKWHSGLIAAMILLVGGTIANVSAIKKNRRIHGGPAATAAIVDTIKPRLRGCLYVFNGDPILYYLTGSCLPTRYPFSTHLLLAREAGAIGVDQLAEISRIFATKPTLVVDTFEPYAEDDNPQAIALGRKLLRRDYRLIKVVPVDENSVLIYQRRDDP